MPQEQPYRDINEALHPLGVEVEPCEAAPLRSLVSTGVGSIAGQALARVAGLGTIGTAIAGLSGAVLGHLAATHRVRFVPKEGFERRPESPNRWSDRR